MDPDLAVTIVEAVRELKHLRAENARLRGAEKRAKIYRDGWQAEHALRAHAGTCADCQVWHLGGGKPADAPCAVARSHVAAVAVAVKLLMIERTTTQ